MANDTERVADPLLYDPLEAEGWYEEPLEETRQITGPTSGWGVVPLHGLLNRTVIMTLRPEVSEFNSLPGIKTPPKPHHETGPVIAQWVERRTTVFNRTV